MRTAARRQAADLESSVRTSKDGCRDGPRMKTSSQYVSSMRAQPITPQTQVPRRLCRLHPSGGSAFDGGEQIMLMQGKQVKSRVPIRDGRSCTHPDDIASREETAKSFLQSSGVNPSAKGTVLQLTGSPGSQGFVFHDVRFKFSGDTEALSASSHKISARSSNLEQYI